MIAGVESSTDQRFTDEALDRVLGYFEAIHWKAVDAGAVQPDCSPSAVFRKRGYWQAKNRGGNTSRDRFTMATLADEIAALELSLQQEFGIGPEWLAAVRWRVTKSNDDLMARQHYRAALVRSLESRRKSRNGCPA